MYVYAHLTFTHSCLKLHTLTCLSEHTSHLTHHTLSPIALKSFPPHSMNTHPSHAHPFTHYTPITYSPSHTHDLIIGKQPVLMSSRKQPGHYLCDYFQSSNSLVPVIEIAYSLQIVLQNHSLWEVACLCCVQRHSK